MLKCAAATLLLLSLTFTADVMTAGEPACCHCGRQHNCRKVCRLVCEMKEVTKVTYGCQCEDVCIPGPSSRERVCSCGECDACSRKSYAWTPHCARVKTRKVPVRHEQKVSKPTYRWVVEYVCDECASHPARQSP